MITSTAVANFSLFTIHYYLNFSLLASSPFLPSLKERGRGVRLSFHFFVTEI